MIKILMAVTFLASTLVATPTFAGRDEAQIRLLERAVAAIRAPMQLNGGGPGAESPSDDEQARESTRARHLALLKRFHPKHAYGY